MGAWDSHGTGVTIAIGVGCTSGFSGLLWFLITAIAIVPSTPITPAQNASQAGKFVLPPSFFGGVATRAPSSLTTRLLPKLRKVFKGESCGGQIGRHPLRSLQSRSLFLIRPQNYRSPSLQRTGITRSGIKDELR